MIGETDRSSRDAVRRIAADRSCRCRSCGGLQSDELLANAAVPLVLFSQASSRGDGNNSDVNSLSSDMLDIILHEDSCSATSGSMGSGSNGCGTSASGTSNSRTSKSRTSGSGASASRTSGSAAGLYALLGRASRPQDPSGPHRTPLVLVAWLTNFSHSQHVTALMDEHTRVPQSVFRADQETLHFQRLRP